MNITNYITLQTILQDEQLGILLITITGSIIGWYLGKRYTNNQWFIKIIYSLIISLSFIVLTIMGYFFLRSNIFSFNYLYQSFTNIGSIAWGEYVETQKDWGDSIRQFELQVNHYVEKEEVVALPTTEPSQPVFYQTIVNRNPIEQNSVVRFEGSINLTLSKDLTANDFNGYFVNAVYIYDVQNQLDFEVGTDFLFPINRQNGYFQNIFVELNGKEIENLYIDSFGIHWKLTLQPNQKVNIKISYRAKGLDSYFYIAPNVKEVNDYLLTISSNSADLFVFVNPTGESVQSKTIYNNDGSLTSIVSIKNAIVAPSVGVSYFQNVPYAPFDLPLRLLLFLPRSMIFLIVTIVFILIISKNNFRLKEMALIHAVTWCHSLMFILLILVNNNPKQTMLVISFLSAVLILLILKRTTANRFINFSIFCWVILLFGFYPLSGETVNTYPFNQFDNLVLAGILFYTFSYLLWTRIQDSSKKKL